MLKILQPLTLPAQDGIDLYKSMRKPLQAITRIGIVGATGYITAQAFNLNPLLGIIYTCGTTYYFTYFASLPKQENPKLDSIITDVITFVPPIIAAGVITGWAFIPTITLIGATILPQLAMVLCSSYASHAYTTPKLPQLAMVLCSSYASHAYTTPNWFFQGIFHGAIGYLAAGTKFLPVTTHLTGCLYMIGIHTLNSAIKCFTTNEKGAETSSKWILRHIITLSASALIGGYLVGWNIIPTLTLVATSLITRLGIQLSNGNKITFSSS